MTYLGLVQIRDFGGSVGVAHIVGIIHTNECCDKDMISIPEVFVKTCTCVIFYGLCFSWFQSSAWI
jgi:hypothetical protein